VLSLTRQALALLFAILALRGIRWAYASFVVLAVAYFPVHVGFHFQPQACEVEFDAGLALFSLTNYAHIVLFGVFFLFSTVHAVAVSTPIRPALTFAAIATLLMGALVELAEGATGSGHCRLRDLIPDTAGMALGAVTFLIFNRAWKTVRRRAVWGGTS
jgi:hypothetical protein